MDNNPRLSRSLTLFPATAIVIGSVIGSGIFMSSAEMARVLGSGPLVLAVWVLAGMMTLAGALVQCELTGQMPRTGGLYEYLARIYGERVGFLYGWANFTIAGSGAMAGLAFVFASFLGEWVSLPHLSPALERWPVHIPGVGSLFPLADIGAKLVGCLLIAALTAVNILGIRIGAALQSVSTSSKVLAILLIIVAAFSAGHPGGGTMGHLLQGVAGEGGLRGWSLIGAMGLALSSAFWAYDGWGAVAFVAGEIREPERTIPRAILLGSGCFIALYLLINIAYLYVLPVGAIASAPQDRVASSVLQAVLGSPGVRLVSLLIVFSTFDTINSGILTNSRVYLAMARDGIFWNGAGDLHPRFRTPHVSLALQGLWTALLLLSGSFDLIVSMYVFVNWLLYALMALGVFILRWREPGRHRPFRVPGYPFVPAAYLVFTIGYLMVTLVADIRLYQSGGEPMIKSVMGLVLVATGIPFYLYWRRGTRVVEEAIAA